MLELIFFIISPVLLFLALFTSSKVNNVRDKIIIFFSIFFLPLIVVFFDEIKGQAYLYSLCYKNGGVTYKKTLNTEGYFNIYGARGCDRKCVLALTHWGYSYYETKASGYNPYHADGKGEWIYKYFIANSDSELCSDGRKIPGEKKLLTDSQCIAYYKIIKPSSRYAMASVRDDKSNSLPAGLIKKYSYIKDLKEDKIIASATSYWYWGGWVRTNSFGSNSASFCPSFENSHQVLYKVVLTSK